MYNPIIFNDEIFKEIVYDNIAPLYAISNYGTVINKFTNKQISQNLTKDGYLRVSLRRNDNTSKHYLVHRLVMITFDPIEDDHKFEVNHIHGVKNDDRFNKLEWVTTLENNHHAFETGLNNNFAENHTNAKLTNDEVREICRQLSNGIPIQEICNNMGNTDCKDLYRTISGILDRSIWKSISKDYIFPDYPNKRDKFTDSEVRLICDALQQGLGYKDILKMLNIDISTLSPKELSNYSDMISNIRLKRYYKDISKDYNSLINSEKSRHDQIFTNSQIETICKLLENNYGYSDILSYLGIDRNNCDKNKYDAYKHCLSSIKNRKMFTSISEKYTF